MQFKPKPKRKEVFLGMLRAEVDEETKNFLRPNALVKRKLIDGIFFFHYADGKVEVKSFHEVVDPIIKEINERKENGNAHVRAKRI